MKNSFPIKELYAASRRLPANPRSEFVIGDLAESTQIVAKGGVSSQAKAYLDAYGPILDSHMDLSGVPARFKETVRLQAAAAVHQALTCTTKYEASLAGTSLPTWTTQKIMMIMRVYPQLIALRLFGFVPMKGPTARIFFKFFKYGDGFTASSPTIAAGDALSDTTKFNTGYFDAPEGSMARTLDFELKHLDISAVDERVTGDIHDNLQDDYRSVYEGDAMMEVLSECWKSLLWVIDRKAITAAVNAVPAANKHTHDANPAAYSSATWTEQQAYDTRVYTHGIKRVIHLIGETNKFNPETAPNFIVAGSDVARLLERAKGFVAFNRGGNNVQITSGPIRDFGRFEVDDLDVIIDPQMTANKALVGRKDESPTAPGIRIGMYIPLEYTKEVYNPKTGRTEKGVRTRFALAQPNTGTQPESSQLGRIYGELTVSNASAV